MHGIAAYLMEFSNAISAKDNVDIFYSQTFNAKITLEAVCLEGKSVNTFKKSSFYFKKHCSNVC